MPRSNAVNIHSFYGRVIAVIAAFGFFSVIATGVKRFDPTEQPPDILQDYAAARALVYSDGIYQPFSSLVSKYVPNLNFEVKRESPVPHSPFNAVVFSPLSIFSFQGANVAWFVVQLLLVLFIGAEIVILIGLSPRWVWIPLISISLAALSPIRYELREGQINLLPTLLFLHSASSLKSGNFRAAGIWFGLSLALKPILWPLTLVFALRSTKALVWTGISLLLTLILTSLVIPPSDVISFFTTHAATPGRIYSNYFANGSLFTIGPRLFEGTLIVQDTKSVISPPLLWSASYSLKVSILISLLTASISFYYARNIKETWKLFIALTPLAVLLSPVSWIHYGTYLAPLVVVLAIETLNNNRSDRALTFLTLLGFMFIGEPLSYVFSVTDINLPPHFSLVGLIPTAVFLVLQIVAIRAFRGLKPG